MFNVESGRFNTTSSRCRTRKGTVWVSWYVGWWEIDEVEMVVCKVFCISSRGPSVSMCVIFSSQSSVDVSRATLCVWVYNASVGLWRIRGFMARPWVYGASVGSWRVHGRGWLECCVFMSALRSFVFHGLSKRGLSVSRCVIFRLSSWV